MFIRIKIVFILLLSISFWAGTCRVVSAAGVCPSEHEWALLELINQARENPLAVAISMGLDPDKIVEDLPELENILTDGLPAVTFNRNLYDAACAHTEDMFARGYYSHDSPDGLGFDERIQNSGYQAVTCGESLGMLGFVNFIDPGDAVGLLFEFMFMDELDPSRSEKRNILGPDFQEIGISLASGTVQVEGAVFNAYLVTCDFASGVSLIELELCQLINQARENPLAVAASMGLDPDQLLEDIPELGEILTGGIPPLRFSRNLHESAWLHALDMLENDYYSHISPDGRTIDDRVAETGYCPLIAGDVMGLSATVDFEEFGEAAVSLFERIFRHELVPGCADRMILNPEMQDVGVSFNASSPGGEGVSGSLNDYYSRLVVADFAASAVAQLSSLIGRAYRDLDGDGMYDPGEGLPGICVLVVQQETDVDLSLFTGPAGDFSASLEPGVYRISADIEDVVFEYEIEMADENRAVEFMIDAAPDKQ